MSDSYTAHRPLPADDLSEIVDRTRLLWAVAKGRRFFITGGTGFFGIWLLESFARLNDELKLGAQMSVLTRAPERFAESVPHLVARSDVELLAGDVRSFRLPERKYDFVIHAASEADAAKCRQNPAETFDVITAGTRHVLAEASRVGAAKFLLVSSGAVYGQQPDGMSSIREEFTGGPDPLTERAAYGEGKRVAEHMCLLSARSAALHPSVARCFSFVGPRMPLDGAFAVGNFVRDCIAGGPVRVQGDGTPSRSYLYAADLAIWLWTILFKGAAARAYNVGSERSVSIAELAQIIGRIRSVEVVIERQQQTDGRASSAYVPCTARARAELGLRERIALEPALEKTINWVAAQ